jgi:flagellar hook-associated protein 1 FlgK
MSSRGAGVDLFVGQDASSLAVNAAVIADHGLVVTGRSSDPGDNEIALEIAALAERAGAGEDLTLNDRYNAIIVGLATRQSTTRALAESQTALVESARGRLEAERGVNLDEELANLILYQRSFEANARVVRDIDEMLDTLVNGII